VTSPTKSYIQSVTQPVTQPVAQPVTPADEPFVSAYSGSVSIPLVSNPNVANLIVPPGGFAGFAQQTPATQQLFARAGRIGGRRSAAKRRRKSAKKKAVRASGRKRRTSTRGKLRKGSPAAKRRMAQLRKMRRRR
jgi:hypothetical protein